MCLELLSELPKLRKVKALPKWIMQITAHKCFHRKQQQQRTEVSGSGCQGIRTEHSLAAREGILREAEDEQSVRQAMAELPPRCRELMQHAFLSTSRCGRIRKSPRRWGLRWDRSDSSGNGAWNGCANACWKRDSRETPENSKDPLSEKLLRELAISPTESSRNKYLARHIRGCCKTPWRSN